jgi:hypothetical protein
VEYRAINTIRNNLGHKIHIEKKESCSVGVSYEKRIQCGSIRMKPLERETKTTTLEGLNL